MHIHTDENSLELRVLETSPGDFYIGVKVQANGFSAVKDSIGIDRRSFEKFVDQFKMFQQVPSGTLALDRMSPGEFQLQFKAVGKKYHVVVQGHLSRTVYQAESALVNTLQFAFRVDASYLRGIVEDFEALLGADGV